MTIDQIIAAAHAKRLSAGLVVSFDRSTPEETAHFGRATAAFASFQERNEEIDRFTWLGLNPRIERVAA